MIWMNSFTIFEYAVIGLFLLFYSLFAWRVYRVGKALNTPSRRIFFKLFFRFAYFSLFIMALMSPSFGDTKKEVQSVGKDIFICVDLSESMNATDVQPTRLEKVKFELQNIIQSFNSDRKGIIMFSNEAFMQCPLTYDNNALTIFIQTMNTNLVPNTGTDFAPPLKMAYDKLQQQEKSTSQKSKIIILISDGEDFGEESGDILSKIESDGIKLFTLGVGTEQGSKIPTRRGFKMDNRGNEVISKLNPTALKELAAKTDGKYFEINSSKNDVERLINTINLIEGELRDSRVVDTKANKYYYFLAIALLLFMFDTIVTIKLIRI